MLESLEFYAHHLYLGQLPICIAPDPRQLDLKHIDLRPRLIQLVREFLKLRDFLLVLAEQLIIPALVASSLLIHKVHLVKVCIERLDGGVFLLELRLEKLHLRLGWVVLARAGFAASRCRSAIALSSACYPGCSRGFGLRPSGSG